jgi:broad specificity phosphatase PhoE
MSRVLLVRHGKASAFTGGDYDELSDVGAEQSRLLGEEWAREGLVPDAVFVGPRKRHAQTLEAVLEAARAKGLAWPEATSLAELDEHDGLSLVFKLLPQLAAEDAALRAIVEAMARGDRPKQHDVLDAFKRLTRRWVRGEIAHDEVESWRAFRARVERALDRIAQVGRGKTIAVFTSAGAVAASVGAVLAVTDERVLDLSWSLHNASVTELAFGEDRRGLVTFNGTPHLRERRLVTSV